MNAAIEQFIDTHGLSKVLEVIETICHEKAAHIEESYQDKELSKVWLQKAKIVLSANYKIVMLKS